MTAGLRAAAVWTALLGVATALAGCSGDGGEALPPAWHGRDLREAGWQNHTIDPEWTLAFEYHLGSGANVRWDWFTPQDKMLYFRMVRMEGETPQRIFDRHAYEDKGSALTPSAGTYMLLLINDGAPAVDVTIRPPEGGLRRTYPPGEGPGCVFFATGVAAATCVPLPGPM